MFIQFSSGTLHPGDDGLMVENKSNGVHQVEGHHEFTMATAMTHP
jgi:hypothetical protein